jgi:hypothetical protein
MNTVAKNYQNKRLDRLERIPEDRKCYISINQRVESAMDVGLKGGRNISNAYNGDKPRY